MHVFAIVIKDHPVSEKGFETLKSSSASVENDFEIKRSDAVTPDTVKFEMERFDVRWNWPDRGVVSDKQTGLRKHAYGGPPAQRHACAMSHYILWRLSATMEDPILILEHDAIFTRKLDPQYILESKYGAIGINEPFGATRLPYKFHEVVKKNERYSLIPVPTIDRMEVPQGLAGGSAYIIKPEAAKELLNAVDKFGLWPNDAILCQQLFNFIGVTTTYYTRVQGLKSTTFTDL